PVAASPAAELVNGRFEPVLDDAVAAQHPTRVRRVALCSGHIWAELKAGASDEVALIRLEELYPFPTDRLMDVLDKYARADETLWVQEEPRNMGAWMFVERQLRGQRDLR